MRLGSVCATVMAVTDELGRVVAQYGYTPYGDLLAAELFANGSDSLAIESLAAARGNRLGHQGLRTERFDRPWDGPLDIASAVTGGTGATGRYRSVCHNRNRMYDPAEGRFTGVDPNGLGVPVLNGLAFGGMASGRGLYNALDIGVPGTDVEINPLHVFASDSGGGSASPRALPPSAIVNSNGVRIVHYYHSNDHQPAHVHVYSDGNKPTRVGPMGRPLEATDRPLTPQELRVFKANRF